jgi:hypothetical protein
MTYGMHIPIRPGISTTKGSRENWTGVCISDCFKMGSHSHSTEPVPLFIYKDKRMAGKPVKLTLAPKVYERLVLNKGEQSFTQYISEGCAQFIM